MTTSKLSQKFATFAERECRDSSPLYESLSLHISQDDELLELCNVARDGQPVPNLLFGAVHYLLMQGYDHPLTDYYPSIVRDAKPVTESLNVVEEIGQTRDVFHLSNNIQDKDLHLDEYVNGVKREQTIAETDGHGRWFRWLLKDEAVLT
ncbi:DUF2332 family protein [Exiguobacterium sp. s150]|uniref:DUF2332 family protein n=1 Tax=Exiguobacterium sp. s150 TaxID=2751221 RepID=UPI00203756AE|nr:DUF2332 family protein [Exiguobacterium sp. s150]